MPAERVQALKEIATCLLELKQKENTMTNASAVPEAAPAQAVSPRGRFFATQTFHYEALRNAGYIVSNCADLGEVLETVKVIDEGDVQGIQPQDAQHAQPCHAYGYGALGRTRDSYAGRSQ